MAYSLAFILNKGETTLCSPVGGLCVHAYKSVPAVAVLLRLLGGNLLSGTFPAVEFNALTKLSYL